MLEEITKSLKASLYERATSSFLGSLIIFWIYFNWDLVLVLLLDDIGIKERIIYVRKTYIDIWSNYWWPIFSAIAYSLIYPYIAIGFYSIARHANSLKIRIRNNIEKKTTISVSDFNNLKNEMYEKENEVSELIERKSVKEKMLLDELDGIKKENSTLNALLEEDENTIKKYQVFKEEYSEKAKSDIGRILDELAIHVSNEHTGGLYHFCKNYYSKENPHSLLENCRTIQNNWLTSVRGKIGEDIYVNVYGEIDILLRDLVQIAEFVRSAMKNSVRQGKGLPVNSEQRNNYINSVKEDWYLVMRTINNLVDAWKRVLESGYTIEKADMEEDYFPRLKPIEESEKSNLI